MPAAPNHLRRVRYYRLLTQEELGAKIGVSQDYISQIERGRRAGGWRTRRRLALALNMPLEEVFPDENPYHDIAL